LERGAVTIERANSEVEDRTAQVLRVFRDATIERTRDAALLVESGEEGLTALVTAEAIELRLPTVVWLTPYTPELRSRFWKRFLWSRLDAKKGLPAVVQRARDARTREFKPCRACGKRTPREARDMSGLCHGCSGLIF
jgi:hypothetical protein